MHVSLLPQHSRSLQALRIDRIIPIEIRHTYPGSLGEGHHGARARCRADNSPPRPRNQPTPATRQHTPGHTHTDVARIFLSCAAHGGPWACAAQGFLSRASLVETVGSGRNRDEGGGGSALGQSLGKRPPVSSIMLSFASCGTKTVEASFGVGATR